MPIDLTTSTLSLADAITIVGKRFRWENSAKTTPTAAYAAAVAQYNTARELWPQLLAVATVVWTLQQDAGNAVNTTNLIAALAALNTSNG
jgi:hypothetical protein